MLLTLAIPLINPKMTEAGIDEIYAKIGTDVRSGNKLVDLIVDLSAAVPHDCPPISCYRLVANESAWLRRLEASPGDSVPPGGIFAWFSTDPAESLDAIPARQLRVSVVGIIKQQAWPES